MYIDPFAVVPTLHSILITDTFVPAENLYMHHEANQTKKYKGNPSNLITTDLYPGCDVDKALDAIKRQPYKTSVIVVSKEPEKLQAFKEQVALVILANKNEYNKVFGSIDQDID